MQQENNNIVLNATELEWLDVTYTAKKYLNDENFVPKETKARGAKLFKKVAGFGAIAVFCLALLVSFTFVKGNFDGNFLQVAKATVTTSVFGTNATQTASLIVPCNMQIDSVNEGVIVLSGGRALTSLTSGTVIQNDENGLAVQVDDNLVVYYNGLVESFVSVGDIVSNNQLLGKYNGTVSASVTYNGQLVVDVVASQSAIQWSI